jgi:methyltransferase (TIGR00027 family)
MDGVALTSLWVAAMRAVESEREDALFRDPFARALAGEQGFDILERGKSTTPFDVPIIPVRTKWIDDHFARTSAKQIAILAAGMDARAFRLDLHDKKVFEVDRDFVFAYKRERIAAAPKCDRVEVPVDLRDDWPAALAKAGFDEKKPTLWLVEGLLVYLEEVHVRSLFARIDRLSAKGSEILFESNNRALLGADVMKARLAFVRELGAPWVFGNEDPTALLPSGWSSSVDDFGDVGMRLGRWPFPPIPKDAPKEVLASVPRTFLVHATKL